MDAEAVQGANAPNVQSISPRPVREPSSAPTPPDGPQRNATDTVSLSNQGRQALEEAAGVLSPPEPGSAPDNPEVSTGSGNNNSQRQIDLTDDQQVVLKIVDQATREVVKQVPPEEQIRLNRAIKNSVEDLTESNNTNPQG